MSNAKPTRRTRRTFPVTVTYQAPRPATPFTPAERDDHIYNGRLWDATVTRRGGGKF